MSAKVVENYSLLDVIGQGQYGKVYKALNIKTNQLVAIKVVKIDKFKEVPKLEEFTMNEIQTLARIDNPYVLKFIEMLKSSKNYYFVYEYCSGGTLEQLINEQGVLPERDAIKFFKMLLKAFTSLVDNMIIHRDLKPSNLMLHNGVIKLGDFGFCKALNYREDLSQTMVGSPIYMAPEILKGQEYSNKVDVWSLGCVLYEMLYGICPFEEKTMAKLLSAIDEEPIKFHDGTNPISGQTKDLLLRMLTKDASRRISWKELFDRELHSDIITSYQPANPNQNQILQGIYYNAQRNKEQKSFKFILGERNKIYFIYQLVDEIFELQKDEKTESKELLFVQASYLLMKFAYFLIYNLKINMVDRFNLAYFPYLQKKMEAPDIYKTQEFKTFTSLLIKEEEMASKIFKGMQEETEKFMAQKTTENQFEQDFRKELQCLDLNITFFRKFLFKFCEEFRSSQMSQFLDVNPTNGRKWLVLIEKILECLMIDEFFENCIDCNQIELENQNFFQILKKYSKQDLLQIINNKMDFLKIREKFN